ncbi:MAG: NAD-dependent epimerase/dehydratase family protein [Candidatus Thermoplasmatota archaeon]|nr:NAD-dependent epimerase/dehydratase family protein [Candidatus Thermoplasmatota archaeon]
MAVLVTGGAGFIGSHLIDALIGKGHEVKCIDNFSSGRKEFIEHSMENGLDLMEGDLLNRNDIKRALKECDTVFHLAANPDVRLGVEDTNVHLEQNIIATYNLLEEMREAGVKKIAFTSSSTVYGDAGQIPTPENYGPLIPISLYGASKLAAEGLISSYCCTFDMQSTIYRFANVVGPRSTHGVTYDFIKKLRINPDILEILGDGSQKKSYLYISDCIEAMLFGMEKSESKVEIFNIGSEDWIDVRRIADIISEEMALSPDYKFTGGVDGGRGWKGDVKVMCLSIDKLKNLGWSPRYGSEQSIRMTARWLINHI